MTPEQKTGVLIILGFMVCAVFRFQFFKRKTRLNSFPDPWGEDIEKGIQQENAVPVCHKCFTPHDVSACFCEQCGASVGAYNNWMPYERIFSEGEVFRTGTGGKFRVNAVTVIGYLLYSMSAFFLFAPLYWFLLFKNIGEIRRSSEEGNTIGQSE